MLVAYTAHGQIRVTGPKDEVLVFENLSFGSGATRGANLTRVNGTVTSLTADHLANAVIKVEFFDYNARVYPRPSIVCRFTINNLAAGETSEIGEKNLKEVLEQHYLQGGLTLKRKPTNCNVVLTSLEISSISLEIISALHGRHVLTTLKAFSRLSREDGNALPWEILKDETEVEVLEYVPGLESQFRVMVLENGHIGFVEATNIVVTPEVEALRRTATDSARAAPEIEQKGRKAHLIQEYGSDTASRILERNVWIGMTRDMTLDSLGRPEKINRTLLLESVHEEWMYGSGLCLYFDNGMLTSYRDNR